MTIGLVLMIAASFGAGAVFTFLMRRKSGASSDPAPHEPHPDPGTEAQIEPPAPPSHRSVSRQPAAIVVLAGISVLLVAGIYAAVDTSGAPDRPPSPQRHPDKS